MILLAQAVLFLWLPAVVGIFASVRPARRAVVIAYVFAWLALPGLSYALPGLPDYTKMTATVAGVLLSAMLLDSGRFFTLRPRWFDLPMVVWCSCPLATSLANDLGLYDGFSASLSHVVAWGLPYLIGRLYLGDLDGARDLATGIAFGGMAYIFPCLIEIRLSPLLELWIYGISHWEEMRYSGYRPKVFLSSGLELGMWMTSACLVGHRLWSAGTVKRVVGWPIGWALIALFVTTILCKSTGAIGLLLVGLATLTATRRLKAPWLILGLLLAVPAYSASRLTGAWSGQEAVDLATVLVGKDRAGSLQFRLDNENILARHALTRPLFGWGGFGRSFVKVKGITTVVDGYWIIALGIYGLVGLVSMEILMLLPMALTLRRFPVTTWDDPRVAPVVGLSLMLCLMMVDFLSNAMMNPVYALAIGCLIGQSPARLGEHLSEAKEGLERGAELAAEGLPDMAEAEFRRAAELALDGEDVESRRVSAESLDGLGHSMLAIGRVDEAVAALREALVERDWLAAHEPEPGRFRDLAIAREGLARALAEAGRMAEAVEERRIALAVWDALAAAHPREAEFRDRRSDALNDLAWILATEPSPAIRDPARAAEMAEEATRSPVEDAARWNTLGVARYRLGDWAGAIEALERSALASPDGAGTAFDHYFLAMAWRQLQDEPRAREWYERGAAWEARHRPGHPTLGRFRVEADSLLGDPGGVPVDGA